MSRHVAYGKVGNMDISVLTQLIASVGFPIVACIALGFFIYKLFEQSKVREEKLINTLWDTTSINRELTKTNAEFVSVLETYKGDLDSIKSDVKEIKQKL